MYDVSRVTEEQRLGDLCPCGYEMLATCGVMGVHHWWLRKRIGIVLLRFHLLWSVWYSECVEERRLGGGRKGCAEDTNVFTLLVFILLKNRNVFIF